jgi:hypothetical protein
MFSTYDAVNAYDADNTVIDAVCSFLTNWSIFDSDDDNAASDAESNPATDAAVSAFSAVIALDADGTIPITLSPLIAPLILEPPLPTTTWPDVSPLNTILTLLLSIDSIAAGIIIPFEPVS